MKGEVVVKLSKYHAVQKEWRQSNPVPEHAYTAMLKDFGLTYVRLTSDNESIRLRVVDERKFMMARMRYNI